MGKVTSLGTDNLNEVSKKNPGTKVNSIIINKETEINPINKITLGDKNKPGNSKIALEVSGKTKSKKSPSIYGINNNNKESTISTTVSDTHIAILFEDAKLLTINQILSMLQMPKLKNAVFTYKKAWHNIVKDLLAELYLEQQAKGKSLPYFDEAVEVTIFRQAPKLVDEDALTPMFKFIIDALKRTKDNPYGVLAEDNPKIMHKISCYSEKGSHCVGIKIRLLEIKKEPYDKYKLLNN